MPESPAQAQPPAPPAEPSPPSAQAPRCLNCDAPVSGRYCSGCGQRNLDSRLSLRQFLVELLGDYFHVDSKLFRSFGLLLVRPGELTRRHLAGRRTRYIKPFKIYVTASVLFFSYYALHAHPGSLRVGKAGDSGVVVALGKPSPESKGGALLTADAGAGAKDEPEVPKDVPGSAVWNRIIENTRDHPEVIGQAVTHALGAWFPRVMFVLVPAFALLLKALYRRRFYVEHFVFALHLHAFVFLVFLAQSFIDHEAFTFATWLLLFAYLFMAMWRVYPDPRWKTVLKGGVLMGSYLLLVGLSLAAVTLTALYFA